NPAATKPACSHCDRGPASNPIRLTPVSSPRKNRTRASGSLATFASRTILPTPSTTHTLLCSNDTSIPAKCSMTVLRACLEPTNSDSASHHHSGGQSPRRGFWRRPITASTPPLPRPADTFWSRQDSTLVISKQSRHGYRQTIITTKDKVKVDARTFVYNVRWSYDLLRRECREREYHSRFS